MRKAGLTMTARTHGLTLVTRNLADLRPFDVALLHPFEQPRRD